MAGAEAGMSESLFDAPEPAEHELELPAALPVLPLKETVVFPQSMSPLAIGQERSVRLIDDVVAGERLLQIAGERKRPKVPGRVYQQMEIETGPFQRQVRLVENVDPERATASFDNGVLTIALPVVDRAPTGSTAIRVRQ